MKAHIGVDAESGLLYTVIGTAANVSDLAQAASLLQGQEQHAWSDAGYQGVDKREESQGSKTQWHVAMRPGKRCALEPERLLHQRLESRSLATARCATECCTRTHRD